MNKRSRVKRRILRHRRRGTPWLPPSKLAFSGGLTAYVHRFQRDGQERAVYCMPGITVRGPFPPSPWVIRELTAYHADVPRETPEVTTYVHA